MESVITNMSNYKTVCVVCLRDISDVQKAVRCIECRKYSHNYHSETPAHVYYERKIGEMDRYHCKNCLTRLLEITTPWMTPVSSSSAALVEHSLSRAEDKMAGPELQISSMCVDIKSLQSSTLTEQNPVSTYGTASTQHINNNVCRKFQSLSLEDQNPMSTFETVSRHHINNNIHKNYQSSCITEQSSKSTCSFGPVQTRSNKRTSKRTEANNGRKRIQIIEKHLNVTTRPILPTPVRDEIIAAALERELRVTVIALEELIPDVCHVNSLLEYAFETDDASQDDDNPNQEDVDLFFNDSILCIPNGLLMAFGDISDILGFADISACVPDTSIDGDNVDISETAVINSIVDMEAEAYSNDGYNIVNIDSTGYQEQKTNHPWTPITAEFVHYDSADIWFNTTHTKNKV